MQIEHSRVGKEWETRRTLDVDPRPAIRYKPASGDIDTRILTRDKLAYTYKFKDLSGKGKRHQC
jgi:hypothetical protein